jgi:hypothetical protein
MAEFENAFLTTDEQRIALLTTDGHRSAGLSLGNRNEFTIYEMIRVSNGG